MLDLGTLKIGIEIDDGSVKQGLENVDSAIEGTGEKTSRLGKVGQKASMLAKAGALAAGAALVKIGKDALKATADYEQLKGGIETLFGTASDTVMKNAQKAYKTAGISANQYMAQATSFSASLLQSLHGDEAAAAKVADMAIRDMADNANKMGTPLESIQNAYQGFAKQNYTMLDNLKLGYGGTKQEMERLLADAGKLTGKKYDINNLNDVYEAIHAIQEEQKITGTTAKEASETISGSVGMAKAAWENFLTALGTGENINKRFGELASSIGTVLKNVLPTIFQILKSMVSTITSQVPKLFEGTGGGFVRGLLTGIAKWIPKAITQIANMIGKIADNLGKDKNNGKWKKTGVEIIKSLVVGLVKAAPKLAVAAIKLIFVLAKTLLSTAGTLVKTGASLIGKLVSGIGSKIKDFVKAGIKMGKAFIEGFVKNHPKVAKAINILINPFTRLKIAIKLVISAISAVKKAWNNLKLKAKNFTLKLIGGAKDAIEKAKGAWNKIKSTTKTWTLKLAGGAASAIEKVKKLWNKIKSGKKTLTIDVKTSLANVSKKVRKLLGLRRGLREVPYDGLQAELHKGERVLTAPEANQYEDVMRKVNQKARMREKETVIQSQNIDYNKLAKAMISALSGVNMTSTLNVDGRTLAKTTAPFMSDEINKIDYRANRKLGYV